MVFRAIQIFAILLSLVSVPAESNDLKRLFGRVTPEQRDQHLAEAEVRLRPDESALINPDVLEDLSRRCGFQYSRDPQGFPVRPTVECQYNPKDPKDPFGGRTAKFECLFPEYDKSGNLKVDAQGRPKLNARKVKYDPGHRPGGGYKEVPQAILGTEISRRLGFYADTYCPVNLVCHDCPNSDPWKESNASSGPAVPGKQVTFNDVVIEIREKSMKIIDTENQSSKMGEGFKLRGELSKKLPPKGKPGSVEQQLRERRAAEREALAIWINLIVHGDADSHNFRLGCKEGRLNEQEGIAQCLHTIAYLTDYGNAFGHVSMSEPVELKKFLRRSLQRKDSQWYAVGAAPESSMYPVSTAGRSLFVNAAKAVTDDQLKDIFALAQVEKVSDASSNLQTAIERWIQAFRTKVENIRSPK